MKLPLCILFLFLLSVSSLYSHQVVADDKTTIENANKALVQPLLSVTQSSIKAPSGDPHDYVTFSTYAWPNPNTGNGLPYIMRDGKANPEGNKYPDRKNLELMIVSVRYLASAYSITHDERYARKATAFINAWFLDAATRMNPNLDYAQIVPGKNGGKGNPSGIIETHSFVDLIDTLTKLPLPEDALDGMRRWFSQYLDWLETSDNGHAAEKFKNNQLTWLTVQKVAIYEFLGKDNEAKAIINIFKVDNLPGQIDSEGAQPEEIKRTKGFNYSLLNLRGLFKMAALAQTAGVDLWNYHPPQGGGLQKALDYLIPYATGEKKWPYQEIEPYDIGQMESLLNSASKAYPEKREMYDTARRNLKVF